VERIDLERFPHGERHRWRAGGEWDRHKPKIAVGRLADGCWYVRRYDGPLITWPKAGACAYAGPDAEWYAMRTAWRWRRTLGGTWMKV
jgi:hypothetical protein